MNRVNVSWKSILESDKGSVGLLFAMLVLPVTLLAGGTVDYGRALSQRARIQSAAEAAALAAARPLNADEVTRISIAGTVFSANIASSGIGGLTPTVTFDGQFVTVAASSNISTPFLNIMHVSSLPAIGSATAIAGATIEETDPGKICILALDPNSDNGIHLQGGNQVNYANCWAHTNSTKTTAINANGNNAKANGKGHCAVGSWTQTHDTFTPTPKSACKVIPDPFATVGAYVQGQTYTPTFTPPTKAVTCKASNLNLKKGVFTLDPGRYCGGMKIQAGATVTLNPGIYYIDDGEFIVQSGSSVSGSNVLLYFAGSKARMEIIGGGTVDLKGRSSSASYAGFLVIANAYSDNCLKSNIQGGGTFKLQGVVYMPTHTIEVAGNGDVNAAGIDVFGMVAKDFDFRGNGVFNAKKHSGNGNLPDIMPSMPVDGIRSTVLN